MMSNTERETDVEVNDAGTIIQLIPHTDEGRAWINENTESEPYQWLGPALCVERRYAENIVYGMIDAGLVVRST